MKRSSHRRTAAAIGACQDHRRPSERRPAWVRSWVRVEYALDASDRLMHASITAATRSHRRARRCPLRSSVDLWKAGARLEVASARLQRAALALKQTSDAVALEPETAAEGLDSVVFSTQRWIYAAEMLATASNEIYALQREVLDGLASGELVPERPPQRRPRIVLKPRPAPVRAFLRVRLARVAERISAVLDRRRRTPRPAALSVPRRTSQGRAPPSLSLI